MRTYKQSTQIIAMTTVVSLLLTASLSYAVVDDRSRDLPQDFSQFLEDCTMQELAQLAMSLRMLPPLDAEDFGKYGIPHYNEFSSDLQTATREKPLRPESFNEVTAESVAQAADAGRLGKDQLSPTAIKRQLVWIANNKVTFLIREKEAVDYHGIVQWVAKKKGVSKEYVVALPTFELEKEITKVYFAQIWDKLTPAQRAELLRNIEEETGTTISDKARIIAMSGSAAIVALSATTAMAGFTFYTTMSVVICTVAGWFGLTLPFWVYTSASSAVALLSGPIGWVLVGAGLVISGVLAGMPSPDKTAAFIMTVNAIKAQRLYDGAV